MHVRRFLLGFFMALGCGNGRTDPTDPPDATVSVPRDPVAVGCEQDPSCPSGATLTGRVYSPNGLDPVAGAFVYLAQGSVAPQTGLTCNVCAQSGARSCAMTQSTA